MIEYQSKNQEELPGTKPTIAVVGIGGAGANVLDRIALEGLNDAELISMNSDVRALANSVAPTKIQLGKSLTQGLGAGGDPDLGAEAAMDSMDEIRDALKGKDLVFLCSGQGGGIGSGSAPLIAQAAKEQGAFVVVFATMPFCFEGKRRLAQARQSLDKYQGMADALITFDNDRMGELILPKEGIQQAFAAADQIISQSIRAVTALVTQPGLIHIGMDDLISALRNNDSRCLFGHGSAKGQNRAQEALKRALKSPLLDKGKMLEKSKNLLVHISGGDSMTLYEVELLMNSLEKHVPETTQILFGASSDKSQGDSLSVTLISSLTSNEMSGQEEVVAAAPEVVQQQAPAQQVAQQVPQQQAAAPAPAQQQQPVAQNAPVSVTSGDSIIPASPKPAPAPAPVAQSTAPPPASAAPPPAQAQTSGATGLGKPSEPVQAASAAVESAPATAEIATTAEEPKAEAAEPAAEAKAPAPEVVEPPAAKEEAPKQETKAEVKPAEEPKVEPKKEEEPSSAVSIGAVPDPETIPVTAAGDDDGAGSGEEKETAVVEVKLPPKEEAKDSTSEDDKASEDIVEETKAEESEEETVKAESKSDEPKAKSESKSEAKDEDVSEVKAEADKSDDAEEEEPLTPKAQPKKPKKDKKAEVAKTDEPKEKEPDPEPAAEAEEKKPSPAVDMASALAEAEANVEDLEEEPIGTMGPAAALGLKAPAPGASSPSAESVGRATITAKDPRGGKQQMLELEPATKGRFDKAEPTVVDGEDLDIPTFLRKKGNYT